jgi:AcrR family transcriptional regulator
VVTEQPRVRADAARNRRAILDATEDLLSRYRPEQAVAAAAGVGKGTVFHRFGNRMGLMVALMQERAADLLVAIESGPPPLGPGAPPEQRLLAFLDAMVDVIGRNKGLLAALGQAVTVERDPADPHPWYDFCHRHVAGLLTQLRPDIDAEVLGHVLLAGLHSAPVLHLLERGDGPRLAATLRTIVTALLDQPGRVVPA